MTATVNLLHVFPAGNAKATGEHRETVLMCIFSRFFKTHIKTHGTTNAALRLPFHPLSTIKPFLTIIVGINKRNTKFLRKTNIFFFAN